MRNSNRRSTWIWIGVAIVVVVLLAAIWWGIAYEPPAPEFDAGQPEATDTTPPPETTPPPQ